jgi:hypothetical protein
MSEAQLLVSMPRCLVKASQKSKNMNPPQSHNRISKVYALVAATLILPTLTYAQNNQGNGPVISPSAPSGFYVFTDNGYLVPPTPGVVGQVPLAAAGWLSNSPNAAGSGGTSTGVVTFSIGGQVFKAVTLAGTFTVNPDGSMSSTVKQTSPPRISATFHRLFFA